MEDKKLIKLTQYALILWGQSFQVPQINEAHYKSYGITIFVWPRFQVKTSTLKYLPQTTSLKAYKSSFSA